LLPRLILPRPYKEITYILGVQAGMLDEDNGNTPVSFGFAAHAFYAFGWTGVAIISFLLGVLLIIVTRVLTPAFDNNIWAVVILGSYQLIVAEATVGSIIQILTYHTAWIVTALLMARLLTELWSLAEMMFRLRLQLAGNPSPNDSGTGALSASPAQPGAAAIPGG
jgi:hypothetical protein